MADPIFILACGGRTGSTRLQRALTATGGVLVWGETGLFRWLNEYRGRAPWTRETPTPRRDLHKFREKNVQMWTSNLLPLEADLHVGFRSFLEQSLGTAARAEGYPRWGCKEIDWWTQDVTLIRHLWPAARILFLTRRIEATFKSGCSMGWLKGEHRKEQFVDQWYRMCASLIALKPHLTARERHLRDEEVNDTTLADIAAWCDLPPQVPLEMIQFPREPFPLKRSTRCEIVNPSWKKCTACWGTPMPTCDLIASARALYNLNNLAVSGSETTTLTALIAAVSKAIAAYCGRDFCSTSHDELYNGDGQHRLLLRHYPLLSVQRVAGCPTVVLRVRNTDSANQRATVAVTATGLTLTRVAGGVSSSATLAFATYPTLAALAAAVTALGNGWSATVTAEYDNHASADLRALQGAVNAAQVEAGLRIHTAELTDFEVDAGRGWLLRRSPDQGWCGGVNYWRVIYTAGYTTIPEDVQEACAQWVAALFFQTKRDPGLLQEQIPGVISRTPLQGMPDTVKTLLAPYRTHRILRTGG